MLCDRTTDSPVTPACDRPTVTLELSSPGSGYLRPGGTIALRVVTATMTGLPVAGASVTLRWTLEAGQSGARRRERFGRDGIASAADEDEGAMVETVASRRCRPTTRVSRRWNGDLRPPSVRLRSREIPSPSISSGWGRRANGSQSRSASRSQSTRSQSRLRRRSAPNCRISRSISSLGSTSSRP